MRHVYCCSINQLNFEFIPNFRCTFKVNFRYLQLFVCWGGGSRGQSPWQGLGDGVPPSEEIKQRYRSISGCRTQTCRMLTCDTLSHATNASNAHLFYRIFGFSVNRTFTEFPVPKTFFDEFQELFLFPFISSVDFMIISDFIPVGLNSS